MHEPRLERATRAGCTFFTDPALASRADIVVAFSERTGGISRGAFGSLNLAAHVGDDPVAVDENRARLMRSLGLSPFREKLVTAEQVHGSRVALVDAAEGGSGAWATGGRTAIPETDGLVTCTSDLPLMLLFADCVPIVLVAFTTTCRAVAVIHSGWRGVRDRVVVSGVRALTQTAGCDVCNVLAYIGPHICRDHYEVGPEVVSQFEDRFVTVSRAGSGYLDLGAAVSDSLVEAGVPMSAQCSLNACTADHTDRFFSYRASGGQTGRHAALAAVVGQTR